MPKPNAICERRPRELVSRDRLLLSLYPVNEQLTSEIVGSIGEVVVGQGGTVTFVERNTGPVRVVGMVEPVVVTRVADDRLDREPMLALLLENVGLGRCEDGCVRRIEDLNRVLEQQRHSVLNSIDREKILSTRRYQ